MTGEWDRSGQDGEPSLGSADLAEARAIQVLRMQAEETAWASAGQMPENLDVLSPETARLLLHERRVHQIEVEAALASVRVIHADRNFLVRDPASVWARIDTLRMEQVIINLLDNAARFSPKDAPVEIDISLDARDEVVISVRDHGEGIAEKDRQRVFERFYQAPSRQHSGGMGLGLYISAQIVEMHGGTISYEVPEGEGSRFSVRLPQAGTTASSP